MHWDHVQGLPFFAPILVPGPARRVRPPQEAGSLDEAFHQFVRPFFPVTVEELYGQITFHDVADCDLEIDGAKVRVRPVPHVGTNNGYRVEVGGHGGVPGRPPDAARRQPRSAARCSSCGGADLVIHGAQYTDDEFAKYYWGHCTVDYAVFVAHDRGQAPGPVPPRPGPRRRQRRRAAGARRDQAETTGLSEVLAAYEGLTVSFGG